MDTPDLSKTINDLILSDQELIKAGINRFGNTVLKPIKGSTNHAFTIVLFEDTIYYCRSTGIINSGDTFTDSANTVFTVTLVASAIAANDRCRIYITGSTASVRLDINT